MSGKLTQLMAIVQRDPAVQTVVGFTGAAAAAAPADQHRSVFVCAEAAGATRDGIDAVMARLRRKLSAVPGARLFLAPVQDIRVGGRQSNAAYQYTLQGDSTAEVYEWAPKLLAALQHDPVLRGRQFRPAAEGAGDRPDDRPRRARPAWRQRRARSTTRCTTPSASARSPPSTAR